MTLDTYDRICKIYRKGDYTENCDPQSFKESFPEYELILTSG